MNTISQETIDKVKKIPLEQFLPKRHRNGLRYNRYICPLHVDKDPSFTWYKDNNTFKCFGCGENGDVIDFIMKLSNVSFQDAVEFLKKYI